ncbi:DsrE family protein [Halopiger thermotolerans]
MKTVVHLLSGDEDEQETALAIARNLLEDETDRVDEVAIVVQADGMNAVRADADTADQVRELLDDDVAFRACSNTLEMLDLDESDLVEGIETVPEGAVEVTRLQSEEGYAYLRP